MDVINKDASEQFEETDAGQGRADQPPESCNTGGSFRFSPISEAKAGGLDWLDLSVYGFWNPSHFDELNEKLGQLRRDAEAGNDAIYTAPAGDELQVQPFGMPGVARWVLAWDGCKIAIAGRAEESETALSVFLHIGSMKLMQDGHVKAVADLRAILSSMGFHERRNVVSRVDLCCDFGGLDCRECVRLLMNDAAICKASKGCMYWKGVPGVESSTGFDLGTETKLRVYNKLVEVAKNPAKRAVMEMERWGEVVATATRVEFQLRRDSLNKNWDVSDYADLIEKLPAIAEWLTHKWFRLADDFDRVNRNHDSAVTASVWQRVQRAFAAVFSGDVLQKPSLRRWVPSPEAVQRQALGCLSTAFASLGETLESGEVALERVVEWMTPHLGELVVAVREKAKRFARIASLPAGTRWECFDEWNGEEEEKICYRAERDREAEAAYRRECVERQEGKDAVHGGRLFEFGMSEVEASF